MEELDLREQLEFEVLGDIKPTIINILGFYKTDCLYDCTVHLVGTSCIEVPAFYPYLVYRGWCADEKGKEIIKELYKQNLIKIHKKEKLWGDKQ